MLGEDLVIGDSPNSKLEPTPLANRKSVVLQVMEINQDMEDV